jgi:glucan phosphoethanolaminetransferase (alkaline phosphatase superfamily)
MLTLYRIAYGLVVAVFLAKALGTHYITGVPAHVSLLLVAVAVNLSCILTLLLGFSRIRTAAFWVLVVAWEAFFTWWAWFSPGGPFTLHEVHSFDPTMAAREATMHYLRAGVLFGLLFAWFLSLPIIRSRYERRSTRE